MGGLLASVKRSGDVTQIYRRISSAITVGQVRSGQAMTAAPWAAKLGVSEAAVDDALGQMVSDGVLVLEDSQIVCLPALSAHRVTEIFAMRCELEGLAGAEAARRVTPALVRELQSLHDTLLATDSIPAWTAANRAFHFEIYEASEMPMLVDMIDKLWLATGPYLHMAIDMTIGSPSEEQRIARAHNHDKVISALRTKNTKATRAAIVEDIQIDGDFILAQLRAWEEAGRV